jgi:hypothetical protein
MYYDSATASIGRINMRIGSSIATFAAAGITAILLCVQPARGGDFFSLTATGTSSSVTAQGSNVINLTENLINEDKQFSSLAGQNISASLTYGGVPHAIEFTENASQTSATLTIPVTGFSKTFTGTSASDLQTQITDFVKSDGAAAYSSFLQAIDNKSVVAALDGNPQAATAEIASDAYSRYGTQPTFDQPLQGPGHWTISNIDGNGGITRASGFDGSYGGVTLSGYYRLTDNLYLADGILAEYNNVGGAEVVTVDENVGLPIRIILRPDDTTGFAWQVTPWGFIGISGSYDEAEGAVLVGGGATSNLSYKFNNNVTLGLIDQGNYTGHIGVTVENYNFDVPIDQWILQNGLQAVWQPGGGGVLLDIGGAYDNLLRHAAIPQYWTGTAGVGVKFGSSTLLRIGYVGDYARHYTSTGGQATLTWTY